jgi:hypothetical protein
VALIGPVSQVSSDGNGAHIEIGFGPGEHVFVDIPPIALQQFIAPPEQIFANKTVCVIGVVSRIDGQLRTIVNKPADIAVII